MKKGGWRREGIGRGWSAEAVAPPQKTEEIEREEEGGSRNMKEKREG